jgi:hypothetical protein
MPGGIRAFFVFILFWVTSCSRRSAPPSDGYPAAGRRLLSVVNGQRPGNSSHSAEPSDGGVKGFCDLCLLKTI